MHSQSKKHDILIYIYHVHHILIHLIFNLRIKTYFDMVISASKPKSQRQ